MKGESGGRTGKFSEHFVGLYGLFARFAPCEPLALIPALEALLAQASRPLESQNAIRTASVSASRPRNLPDDA